MENKTGNKRPMIITNLYNMLKCWFMCPLGWGVLSILTWTPCIY